MTFGALVNRNSKSISEYAVIRSADPQNFLIKPDRLVEVSIILRVLDDALITFEESRRIRIDIFAYWNSPEANEHLLTFFRQQKIYEQLAGVRVRRLSR